MANTFESYLVAMATYAQKQTPQLTDVQPGSIFRSLLEAVASQLELQYFAALDLTTDAITEAAYRPWGFDKKPASATSGVARFSIDTLAAADITIPLGTQVRVPGTDKVYRTTVQAVIPAGSDPDFSVDLLVTSIGAGSFYNTAAGTIIEFVNAIDPTLHVNNPAPFSNGRDEETDDERLNRFASFVRALHRGTADSIEYAAETTTVSDASGIVVEVVQDAKVVDVGAGLARCYIANGTSAGPSSELLEAADANVQLYKAAGVTVQTLVATLVPVVITCNVRLADTHSLPMVATTVISALTSVVQNLKIGEVLYLEQLRHAVMDVPGIIDTTITAPASNTDPGTSGQVVLTSTPTITEL